MKRCHKCNQNKDESEFSQNKARKDGLFIWCKTCSSLYTKKYNIIHEEERKNYYIKNKLKIKKMHKQYQTTHRKQQKEYREKNKQRIENWRSSVNAVYLAIKQNAKIRNDVCEIKQEDFNEWYNLQDKVCVYCKRSIEQVREDEIKSNSKNKKIIRKLGIDRKNNLLSYSLDNIVLCCKRCNETKNDNFSYDEMTIIGKFLQEIYHKRHE